MTIQPLLLLLLLLVLPFLLLVLPLRPMLQELNTDDDLYRALCKVAADREAMEGFSEEQRRVVKLHKADFERGGIHLSGQDR